MKTYTEEQVDCLLDDLKDLLEDNEFLDEDNGDLFLMVTIERVEMIDIIIDTKRDKDLVIKRRLG